MLIEHRAQLLACKDLADIFTFVNSLVESMDLDAILDKTEEVFFGYCRKSAKTVSGSECQ
eukprot:UC1_evm1s1501